MSESPRPAALADELKQARQEMLGRLPEYVEDFRQYDQADTDWLEAEAADALLSVRIRVKPNDFKQPLADVRSAMAARAAARGRLEQISPRLVPMEQLAMRRLAAALALADVEKVTARIPKAQERLDESRRVRAALGAAAPQVGAWIGLRNRMTVVHALLGRIETNRENAALHGSLEKNMSLLVRQIRELQSELSRVRYPFQHATKEPTLAEFLLPQPFNDRDWSDVLSAANAMLQQFPRLYARMLGVLTALAEEVEAIVGLPRLPAPPKDAPAATSAS